MPRWFTRHVEQWEYPDLSPDPKQFPEEGEVRIEVEFRGVQKQQMRTEDKIEGLRSEG